MIYVFDNKRYRKLKRDEYIKEGAMQSWCHGELHPIKNTDGKTIGDKPSSFSDERDFYNIVGEETPHLKYDWDVILSMGGISKRDLIKKCGLDKYTYDIALPQNWLDWFCKEHNLDYHMVVCTTVYVYTDFHRWGIACSCCNEIQTVLDKINKENEKCVIS